MSKRVGIEIGTQEGLWLEFASDVANQHITDRDETAGVMPDSGAGYDLDQAFTAAIPAGDREAPLAGLATGETFGERWLSLTDHAWPPDRAASATRRWIEQPGVEAQAGDHADPPAHGVEQLDRGEAAVGDRDDASVGKPAGDLEQHLSSPIGQLLVPPVMLARIPLGRCKDGQERQCPDAPGPWNLRQQHER